MNGIKALLTLISLATAGFFGSSQSFGRIHRAPIIIKAKDIPRAARYPTRFYRLYRSSHTGEATPIRFQIDEVNELGDFVLDKGKKPNNNTSNGYFDNLDELSLMGDDVGPIVKPKKWPENKKPHLLFEITLKNDGKSVSDYNSGAVYLGIFFSSPPPLAKDKYVVFDLANDVVRTSRYEYFFDKKNYLVVKNIDMMDSKKERKRMVDSSTFFMKADLKYFLTVDANHRSVNSNLEAYKIGPVRTIVRVNFFYSFMSLNFEVGMYTEVSFFSNSVILPAVIYNPIDGVKNLNDGSGFYYGFALNRSPDEFNFSTNMEEAFSKKVGLFSLLERKQKHKTFWASLIGKDSMMYVELRPSQSMLKEENVPFVFIDKKSSDQLQGRDNNKALPLGQSPVNMALYFDLTRFSKGEHLMAFQLFFENKKDDRIIESFKSLSQWSLKVKRI